MTIYAVFGLGMMGQAICHDLLVHEKKARIHAIDGSPAQIDRARQVLSGEIQYSQMVISKDNTALKNLLETVDIAIGAMDYSLNELLTEVCIQTHTHFLDLGGNPQVVVNQHKFDAQAKDHDVAIIPDLGLAPGMSNILAAALIEEFDDPDECHIRVGGLPQQPTGILKYQQVFSIRGLTNEYLEDAIVIRDGKITKVPSLTEVETLVFPEPFGLLEAFQTAGGTASLPKLYEGRINQLTYKTIRYPGHVQFFQFLKEFNLLEDSPIEGCQITSRQLVEKHLSETLPKNNPDAVLIRIQVCGEIKSEYKNIVLECIDLMDQETGHSAMARTTAYPISIIAQMLARGKISQRGVLYAEEVVDFVEFMKELDRRNIRFSRYEK